MKKPDWEKLIELHSSKLIQTFPFEVTLRPLAEDGLGDLRSKSLNIAYFCIKTNNYCPQEIYIRLTRTTTQLALFRGKHYMKRVGNEFKTQCHKCTFTFMKKQ